MKTLKSNTPCPCCAQPMHPTVLGCANCQVEIRGPVQQNEFASLSDESLHLLRIFVHCEGRVREMESALGLSYPTIRTRLSDLRAQLGLNVSPEVETTPKKTLDLLASGELTYEQALKKLKEEKS